MNWELLSHFGAILLPIVTGAIGGFAFYQWSKDKRIGRAELLEKLLSRFGQFDIDNIVENIGCHNEGDKDVPELSGEESERKKFFGFLSYICYLKNNGVITDSEFNVFKWELVNVLEMDNVQRMLLSLYKGQHIPKSKPYHELLKYGEKNCVEGNVRDFYRNLNSGQLSEIPQGAQNEVQVEEKPDKSVALSTKDGRTYGSHLDVLNGIFGFGYLGHMQAVAKLNANTIIWFPKYKKNSADGKEAKPGEWENILSEDGKMIEEYWPQNIEGENIDDHSQSRITFGLDMSVKGRTYRFLGVFRFYETDKERRCHRYIREKDYLYDDEVTRATQKSE